MNQDNPLAQLESIEMGDLAGQELLLLDPNDAPPELDELQHQLEQRYPAVVTHHADNMALIYL